jgi:hypothetical protein
MERSVGELIKNSILLINTMFHISSPLKFLHSFRIGALFVVKQDAAVGLQDIFGQVDIELAQNGIAFVRF